LRWEWFRIYFESGVVKIASGDRSWRQFTAMDDYYQNGPLPTWIGWYVQHFPHWFHASCSFFALFAELILVWMLFLPRRLRILCFCILTPFQIVIILTANYTFLNYLVLLLGVLLLDDRTVEWVLPQTVRQWLSGSSQLSRHAASAAETSPDPVDAPSTFAGHGFSHDKKDVAQRLPSSPESGDASAPFGHSSSMSPFTLAVRRLVAVAALGMVFYVTTAELLWMFFPALPLPDSPVRALEPSRIANRYGLFAVMTHERYEIEFQGTTDGTNWTPYPFRFKPQALDKAPGIYAPYQPRFEWCLWFASLDNWRGNRWVVWTEERLLKNDPDVLKLFASNPFASAPPARVRAVLYQYWFTDLKTKHDTGNWWRREFLGEYAPTLERTPDGKVLMLDTSTADLQ
jgi:hypothetical protein